MNGILCARGPNGEKQAKKPDHPPVAARPFGRCRVAAGTGRPVLSGFTPKPHGLFRFGRRDPTGSDARGYRNCIARPCARGTSARTHTDRRSGSVCCHASVKGKNEDAVGFIRIPEADIAYPIVQGTDNDEYLYQSFEGEYSIAGTVFMDWENHRDFSDPNTILYGHHMKDGSMFHNLSAFRQAAFQDTRIEIELIGEHGIARYLVYSVYNVPQDAPYRRIHFTDAADVAAFIQETHKQSEILFDADPTGAKQIITLSTCTPNQEEYRIAVHALLLAE